MIPTLLWHQTSKHVHITIEINNVSNEKIGIAENNLTFSGQSNQKNYEITFELSNSVIPKESAYAINDNNIKIILTKKEPSSWSFLQKDKNLFKNNIKTNWELWDDSDDEEELANIYNQNNFGSNQFNMEEMMKMFQNSQQNQEEPNDTDCCQESNCCDESNCCVEKQCCNESNCCVEKNCSIEDCNNSSSCKACCG